MRWLLLLLCASRVVCAPLAAHYRTLGLPLSASKPQIRGAYKKLALRWHPDKRVSRDRSVSAVRRWYRINEAYQALSQWSQSRALDAGGAEHGEQGEQEQETQEEQEEPIASAALVRTDYTTVLSPKRVRQLMNIQKRKSLRANQWEPHKNAKLNKLERKQKMLLKRITKLASNRYGMRPSTVSKKVLELGERLEEATKMRGEAAVWMVKRLERSAAKIGLDTEQYRRLTYRGISRLPSSQLPQVFSVEMKRRRMLREPAT